MSMTSYYSMLCFNLIENGTMTDYRGSLRKTIDVYTNANTKYTIKLVDDGQSTYNDNYKSSYIDDHFIETKIK